jgi:hypothetical protein
VDAGQDREYSRQPRAEDLAKICAALNREEARYVRPDEMDRYDIIRVADEVVVDLMTKACGVTWQDAAQDSEVLELDGVEIPIAGIETLIRTKQTVRPHDAADREFLERLLRP